MAAFAAKGIGQKAVAAEGVLASVLRLLRDILVLGCWWLGLWLLLVDGSAIRVVRHIGLTRLLNRGLIGLKWLAGLCLMVPSLVKIYFGGLPGQLLAYGV